MTDNSRRPDISKAKAILNYYQDRAEKDNETPFIFKGM